MQNRAESRPGIVGDILGQLVMSQRKVNTEIRYFKTGALLVPGGLLRLRNCRGWRVHSRLSVGAGGGSSCWAVRLNG